MKSESYYPPVDNPDEQLPEEKTEFPPVFSVQERNAMQRAADNFINQAHEQGFDSLVFLDRSARPFSHLILERWKARFPDEQPPDVKFVKIGREMYSPRGSFEYPTDDKIKDQYAEQIHETFIQPNKKETYFAGKKVLICDEYCGTGGTLKFAKDLFQRAIGHEAKIIGIGALSGTNPFHGKENKNFIHPLSLLSLPASGIDAPITETDSILVAPLSKHQSLKNNPEYTSLENKKYTAAIKEIKEIARENLPEDKK